MKKCVVIYNPQSGHKNIANLLPQIKKILSDYDYDAEILCTEYKGHATEIVKKLEHVDLVISMGGDGTFNESVTGNFMRKDRLVCAHIPVGTTNDIGVMMGYGMHSHGDLACRVVAAQHGLHHLVARHAPVVERLVGVLLQLVAQTPHDDAGRVAVALHPLADVIGPVVHKWRTLAGVLVGPLVVQFVDHQHAVLVTQLDELARVGIVRGTDMVDAELLHQLQALLDGTRIGGSTQCSQRVVVGITL